MTLLLSLFTIIAGLAVLERIIRKKKNENKNKILGLIRILIVCLLLALAYFITDTTVGILPVFASMITYISIFILGYRMNAGLPKYLVYIIGIPIVGYLTIKATQNLLIPINYIFLFILVISSILGYSTKIDVGAKEFISSLVGILGAVALVFTYPKFTNSEQAFLYKQEMVAQEFLEEELDREGFEAYISTLRNMGISLRGEETEVRAYDSVGKIIIMTYKNNEIIDWEEAPHTYDGETDVNVGTGDLTLEDTPENMAEEIVMNNFLYSIIGDFDSLANILADTEINRISIENERVDYKGGSYIESYTLHEIITLSEEEYDKEELENKEPNPLYYYRWETVVEEYGLIDYKVIRVDFTQKHSEKANEMIPQNGDGRYFRSFIVGKSLDDDNYKIYDFGEMF